MKTSEALKIVKSLLSEDANNFRLNTYICFAADEAEISKAITWKNCAMIKAHIRQLLGNCNSLEAWLRKHHGIGRSYDFGEVVRTKLQVTRHAWVDNMIAEFQSKGD